MSQPVQIDPTEGLRLDPNVSHRLEWSWISRPDGSTADFDNDETYRPSFTPDLPGTYRALVTAYDIWDTGGNWPRAFAEVEIGTGNLTPIALIRARGMPNGSTPLLMDGSASYDVDGDTLSYQWTVESTPIWQSVAAFADPTAPITNLRLDYDGEYTVGLTVEDEHSATSATVFYNFMYFANYGGTTDVYRYGFDQTFTSLPFTSNIFELGDLSADPPLDFAILGFRLDVGSEPFPDSVEFDFDSLAWNLSTPQDFLDLVEYLDAYPQGHAAARISPDPDFTDLTFIFGDNRGSLTLKDVLGTNLPRQDVIDAGAEFYLGSGSRNVPPVPSTRFEQLPGQVSQTVMIDPYATTDLDATQLNGINWGLTIAPPGSGASLGWAAHHIAPLTPPVAGDYVVTLRAHDWSLNDSTNILIPAGSNPDLRPVAVIEPVTSAPLASVLHLDGTQSYDLDGDLLSWSWSLLSQPQGSGATLTDATEPRAQFTPDEPGIYIIQLQVSGGGKTSVPTTFPILVDTPLPVADAGRDQLPNFEGEAMVDSSASAPGITNRMWQALRIRTGETDTEVDDPMAVETEVVLPRHGWLFVEALKNWPAYHFTERSPDPGYCDYDIRQPSDVPGANPSEPVSLTLTAHGEIWGPPGLMQVWEIENEREYTREITLIDEDTTVYGTYTLPGEVSIFIATPDTGSRELFVEVASTLEASGYGQNSPFTLSALVCTWPGSDVLQVSVSNESGYALPATVFVGDANIRPVVDQPADLARDLNVPVVLTGIDYSYDANGGGLNYSWALIHRPAGSAATLDGTPINSIHTGPDAEFTPDMVGLYLVQLIAADSEFISVPAVIVVEVGGEPPPCRQCSVRSSPSGSG